MLWKSEFSNLHSKTRIPTAHNICYRQFHSARPDAQPRTKEKRRVWPFRHASPNRGLRDSGGARNLGSLGGSIFSRELPVALILCPGRQVQPAVSFPPVDSVERGAGSGLPATRPIPRPESAGFWRCQTRRDEYRSVGKISAVSGRLVSGHHCCRSPLDTLPFAFSGPVCASDCSRLGRGFQPRCRRCHRRGGKLQVTNCARAARYFREAGHLAATVGLVAQCPA